MKHPAGKEDAVSPVIGVMLMIVVTVVIAAVVVMFSTGMAGDSTATTPMALFESSNQQVIDGNIEGTPVKLLKTFDLVHKGGDEVEKEYIQVVIEPSGTNSAYGIQLVRKANELIVPSGDSTLTTGDRIRITLDAEGTSLNEKVRSGDIIKWTLSDTRTNGVIAKGEFVIPKA